jgi:cytochrome-b5 reductase
MRAVRWCTLWLPRPTRAVVAAAATSHTAMLYAVAGSAVGAASSMYYFGQKRQAAAAPLPMAPPAHCAVASECCFNPKNFTKFRLVSSAYETHDTRRFTFALPTNESKMNLPTASCIVLKFKDEDGKDVVRPYTPTSTPETTGRFELIVKRYPKAKMGSHLFTMRPGEEIDMKGPFMKLDYAANKFDEIGMIAGGTGITPMYQIINDILKNPKDTTELNLVYLNKARRDMILANELNEMVKTYPQFNMYLMLQEAPKKWLGGVGLVTKDVLQTFMPKVAGTPGAVKKSLILVCGPPPMMKAVSGDKDYSKGSPQQGDLAGMLKEMGYKADQVLKF